MTRMERAREEVRAAEFGRCAQGVVRVLTLGVAPGPVLEVLDLGATVHRLWVTGGDGVRRNVVLGHAGPQEYLDSSDFLGASIGRYANRIDSGRFVLDGHSVQLDTNDRGNHLHGGTDGFHRRLWEVVQLSQAQAVLRLVSAAGDQGFPGELVVHARFEVTDRAVQVHYEAVTSHPTVVNLTNHAYFNLDGDGSGPVDSQVLQVGAGSYLAVDERGIPGALTAVEHTVFDLRAPARLGPRIARSGGFDHSFALDGAGWRHAASLDSPVTATRMELSTDQPGLQVYTGTAFDGSRRSSTGRPYERAAGIALEPQLFPDTPNRPELGSAVLRPGETYTAGVEWRFTALGIAR